MKRRLELTDADRADEDLEHEADSIWSDAVFAGNPPSLMRGEEQDHWLLIAKSTRMHPARGWREKLKCAFCLEPYEGDEPLPRDVLVAHILKCEKHPIGVELRERTAELDHARLVLLHVESDRDRAEAIIAGTWPNDAVEAEKEKKDAAYSERDKVVAAFAACAAGLGWPVYLGTHVGEWEDDWRNIVFVDTPYGQVSWHYHDSERNLFSMHGGASKPWDGHSTPEKYEPLWRLTHDGVIPKEA